MKQILFPMTLICIILLAGCGGEKEASEKVLIYQENNEIIGEERDELVGEISPTIYEKIVRSNEGLEEIMLFPVERPGESVTPPAGRYTLQMVPVTGRVAIYDENDIPLLDEVIDGTQGAETVTVSLNGSHTVHVSGMMTVYLRPAQTELSSTLNAGIWEVGVDIEPGNYTVTAPTDIEMGYLQIFEEGKKPRVFEIINNPTRSTVEVDLEEGQILKITQIRYLNFE